MRRLAVQTNTARTKFNLKPFALHQTGSLLLCLLPSKVHVRFQWQRTLLVRRVFCKLFYENEELENEGKNSNTVLNDGQQVEIFLYV